MKRIDVDKLNRVLDQLRCLAEQGIPIIVEGKRDKRALEELDVHGEILTITAPIEEIAERVSRDSNEAVILTDYDRRGSILAGKLRDLLMNEGVTPNLSIRQELKQSIDIEFIEELPSLLLEIGI